MQYTVLHDSSLEKNYNKREEMALIVVFHFLFDSEKKKANL
jgi:hypothetical protein